MFGNSLVDTHAHLDLISRDSNQVTNVVRRASEAEVHALISVGIDLESSRKAVSFASKFGSVYASVGIHPNDADQFSEQALNELRQIAKGNKKVVAWGEIGLDFYRKRTERDTQIKAFEAQIEAAASMSLPIIIHARQALSECIDVIRSFLKKEDLSGVFHCYSGDIDQAKKVLDLGFYISFTGVITFPKAEEARDVCKFVPLDRILIETDSPFLTPVPFRGKPNEPAYVRLVAEAMAKVKGISFDEVASCTTENAKDLFALSVQ